MADGFEPPIDRTIRQSKAGRFIEIDLAREDNCVGVRTSEGADYVGGSDWVLDLTEPMDDRAFDALAEMLCYLYWSELEVPEGAGWKRAALWERVIGGVLDFELR